MTSATKRLLFVCTGNTCRSPMAEHFFMRLSRDAGLSWTASSAGTQAAYGMPLSRGAAAVFAKNGIGPVEHRARRVDAALMNDADRVYVLESMHRDFLARLFPDLAAKVFVLRESAGLTPIMWYHMLVAAGTSSGVARREPAATTTPSTRPSTKAGR